MSLENNSAMAKVLQAKEERAHYRKEIALNAKASISLSLNIAGYPKANKLLSTAFNIILADLKIVLQANRIISSFKKEINIIDEAGHFFLLGIENQSLDLKKTKLILEDFEEKHELSRLIDADLFDNKAEPISSGKKKACLICADKAAIDCMRNKTHSFEELRAFTFDKVQSYISETKKAYIKRKLSDIATKALLYEVSLSPKPGLVDFNNAGAHKDMNYYSFIHSSTAISQFWVDFAESGINYEGNLADTLPIVRQIGLKAEEAMFMSTNNVNTQKGLIFLLGLSVFLSAYLYKVEGAFSEDQFVETLQTVCANLIKTELENPNQPLNTHGENTFKKYGKQGAGARYEAQQGFPVVFSHALPLLEKTLKNKSFLDKENTDKALKTCLVKIISTLDDSNVLYRKGLKEAEFLKGAAHNVLNNNLSYIKFCEECKQKNISPGGSADMLALTLFFYFVKQEIKLEQ